MARRPKLPPASSVWIFTCSGFRAQHAAAALPDRRSGTGRRPRSRTGRRSSSDDAVQRLHRRVGEIGELVGRLDQSSPHRPSALAASPSLPRRPCRAVGASAWYSAIELGGATGFRRRLRPTRPSARRGPSSRPRSSAATTATPDGTWTTSTTPGTALAAVGVERLHRRAEPRRTRDHRGQHAGQLHVHRELRRAVGLRSVSTRGDCRCRSA